MSIFNRNKKEKLEESSIPKDANDKLYEWGTTNDINLYNFVQGIRILDNNYINNDALIEKMLEDSVISSALDLWTEDSLQRDPQTKDIFHIEVDTPESYVEDELSKGLTLELESFLKKDLDMEKRLVFITKRLLAYGDCPVKLDFADTLVDDKLKLKESEVDNFTRISHKITDLLGGDKDTPQRKSIDDKSRLNEDECFNVDLEYFENNNIDYNHKALKNLREDIENRYNSKSNKLNEAELLDAKQMMQGRWYTEIIGHGTNIYSLSSKQKLIAYLDRDYPNKFIKPDRIVDFSNCSGKHSVLFEVGDQNTAMYNKQFYRLERGESFLENAMTSWQVLSALEDILLLTRMTRSILYRIFSVEVGNKGNRETSDLLQRLKNKIKMDETVDIRSKIYNSSLKQVPLGDSIFIPTRNGVGVIDVKTVGGDVNLRDAIDLDYFKDKLFAGLRIPAPYLGFTESLPGGIGDTSLTRMDIRYSRTITRIQTILSSGLKDICLLYLKLTRTEKAFNKLPDFKVVFTSINSAEDASRIEQKRVQMDTLKNILDALKTLGVDISANPEGYEKTRQQLIKEYFGSVLLEKVLNDEKAMVVEEPTEGNSKDLGGGGSDFDSGSSDIISGPGMNLNNDIDSEEDIEDTDVTQDETPPNEDINPPEENTETRELT